MLATVEHVVGLPFSGKVGHHNKASIHIGLGDLGHLQDSTCIYGPYAFRVIELILSIIKVYIIHIWHD